MRTQKTPEASSAPSVASRKTVVPRFRVPEVSVVCPFFNEERIIGEAVTTLIRKIRELGIEAELIVVNDGSTDGSGSIAADFADKFPELRVIGYRFNRGRGYALRKGIAEARGAIIITTEIDLSWGEDIVERLYTTMNEHPDVDIVVASPNLPGGGYKNVPWKRVLVSRLGNWVIRACMTNTVSMNTGMTRAYRRDVINSIPLEEEGKEFHLEVIMKAHALRYKLYEIPCVLEWKAHKQDGRTIQRKSSSRIKGLIVSHTLFSLFANPIRYVWALSAGTMLLSVAFFAWSVLRLLSGLVSVFTLIVSLSLAIISLVFFAFGVIAQQGNMVQRELWTAKRELLSLKRTLRGDEALAPPSTAVNARPVSGKRRASASEAR